MFRPILITARLQCGVVSDAWLPLDGVLLYESCRRRYGGGPEASIPGRGSLNVSEKAPTLPLLLAQDGDFRYYSCSFAEWGQPYSEGKDHWNKRDDVDRYVQILDSDVKRVETGKGRYKAYHMPVFYRVAPFVRWWAVGDAAEVWDLLSGVTHIGKKRVYGWGSILSWEVEEASEDRSVIWHGEPQRSVPITEKTRELVTRGRQMFWGYYPPYYDRRNQADCFLPVGIRLAELLSERKRD